MLYRHSTDYGDDDVELPNPRPKFYCHTCNELRGPFISSTCMTCSFVSECLSATKSHCAIIGVPRYNLHTLPKAVSIFREKGWDIVVTPRTGPFALFSRALGLDCLDLELRAREATFCNGRPVSRDDQVPPTPCMVQNAKHQQCDSCAFRNSPRQTSGHEALLLRCTKALATYDNEAVEVSCSNAELAFLIPVIEELQTSGWNVSIDCWKRFPAAKISIRPALLKEAANVRLP
jgi:hypothetical protein